MILFFCFGLARSLTVLESFEYTTEEEWSYFTLDPGRVEGNLRVSMFLNSVTECALALDFNKYPVFDEYKDRVEADFSDYDAWKLGRGSHFIIVPEGQRMSSIIIGIGNPNSYPANITVSLKYEISRSPLCPNDCSGNGVCEDNECSCNEDFIGYDCNTRASLLDHDRWYSYYISKDFSSYCYFPLKDSLFSLSVTAEWEGNTAMIAFDYEGYDDMSIPTERDFYRYIYLNTDSDQKRITFNVDNLEGDYLYIALLNTLGYDGEIMVLMKIEAEYKLIEFTLIVYIFIVISAFFLSLVIFVAIIRCRRDNRPVLPNEQTAGVPIEIIDRRFPKFSFVNEEMTNCIICLDDFKTNDSIRKLSCAHIFHAKCIEEWLIEHRICCLCKSDCLENEYTVDATRNNINADHNRVLIVSNLD